MKKTPVNDYLPKDKLSLAGALSAKTENLPPSDPDFAKFRSLEQRLSKIEEHVKNYGTQGVSLETALRPRDDSNNRGDA